LLNLAELMFRAPVVVASFRSAVVMLVLVHQVHPDASADQQQRGGCGKANAA
jgi:hypothetical protein